jgi:hypothetical protein
VKALEHMTDAELDEYELELLREEAAEAAHDSLFAYVQWAHPEWDAPMWFHEELAKEIQAWDAAPAGEDYILCVVMPPGHAKSSYVTSACAWMLGRDPTQTGAYVSYNQEKAEELGEQTVDQLASPLWREVFGEVYLPKGAPVDPDRARDTQKKVQLVTRAGKKTGGSFTMAGWKGGLTSGRYNWIIMDDLLKGTAEERRSVTLHGDQWAFLNRVVLTRDKYKSPTKAMIIATRWFKDDLTGQVLEKLHGSRVKIVHFEAIKDKVEHPADPREDGDALWPEMRSKAKLEEKRINDPAGYAALEQGNPVPEGGDIIKPDWIHYYDVLPAGPGTYYQSWDTKAGSKAHSAECVGQLWFIPEGQRVAYFVDEVAGVWDLPETLAMFDMVQNLEHWHRTAFFYLEMKGDAVTLVQTRRNQYPGMLEVNPRGEKTERLRRVSGFYQAGNVRYPNPATPQAPDINRKVASHIAQITTFSVSALKDKGDAVSQFLEQVFLGDRKRTPEEQARHEDELLRALGMEL